jgi:esterase/lipase superfamily enzyme
VTGRAFALAYHGLRKREAAPPADACAGGDRRYARAGKNSPYRSQPWHRSAHECCFRSQRRGLHHADDLAKRFKIANIVLIAPDLDIDVAPTKMWKVNSHPDLPYGQSPNPAGVFPSPELHITVYVSPNDKALATSGWMLGSIARLGRIDVDTLRPEDIAVSRELGSFDVIDVTGTSCFICHSYFVSNPRVSSDLIALLRYGLRPNEPGRPLIELEKPFWRVPTVGASNALQ